MVSYSVLALSTLFLYITIAIVVSLIQREIEKIVSALKNVTDAMKQYNIIILDIYERIAKLEGGDK